MRSFGQSEAVEIEKHEHFNTEDGLHLNSVWTPVINRLGTDKASTYKATCYYSDGLGISLIIDRVYHIQTFKFCKN